MGTRLNAVWIAALTAVAQLERGSDGNLTAKFLPVNLSNRGNPMNKAEFLKRAAAGEQVCIVEKLESSVANLKLANDTLDQQFSSREDAQRFGVENGLNPFSWQAVSDTSYYNSSKT